MVYRPNRLTPQELARRLQGVTQLLASHKVPPARVQYLVHNKRLTPQRVAERLKIMRDLGVPKKEQVGKLDLEEKRFQERLAKYRGEFTQHGQAIYDYLVQQGVSDKMARSLARPRKGKQFTLKDIQDKFTYLATMPLDPKRFGVERIPVSTLSRHLHKKPSRLRRSIKGSILDRMEDAHSASVLDSLMRGWRKKRTLHEGSKKISPTRVLANLRASEHVTFAAPTAKLLSERSAVRIRQGQGASKFVSRVVTTEGKRYVIPSVRGTFVAEHLLRQRNAQIHEIHEREATENGVGARIARELSQTFDKERQYLVLFTRGALLEKDFELIRDLLSSTYVRGELKKQYLLYLRERKKK